MLSEFEAKRLVELANDRLRAGRIGTTLEIQGKNLWLHVRGTFPPKPGDSRTRPYQTRISLGYRAIEKEAIKDAEVAAKTIGLELNRGTFDWRKFSDYEELDQQLAEYWVERFEKEWWQKHDKTNASQQNTWRATYKSTLSKLPKDKPLTVGLLTDWIIENSEPQSRMRGHYVVCGSALAELAGLPTEQLKKLRSQVRGKPLIPRSLPTDAAIAEFRATIKDEGWRYIYGLLATYGLRPHEVWYLDLTDFPIVRVREGTKTGARPVQPLYPEWAEEWKLDEVVYPDRVQIAPDMSNHRLGNKVSYWFSVQGSSAYNLRHCYARRCVQFGIPANVAARLMGHTLAVHENKYQAWVGEKVYLDRAAEVIGRGDRPLPPEV